MSQPAFVSAPPALPNKTLPFVWRFVRHGWWLFLLMAILEAGFATFTMLMSYGIIDSPAAKDLKVEKGEMAFKDVAFHYDDNTPLFERLTLNIPAGQKVEQTTFQPKHLTKTLLALNNAKLSYINS